MKTRTNWIKITTKFKLERFICNLCAPNPLVSLYIKCICATKTQMILFYFKRLQAHAYTDASPSICHRIWTKNVYNNNTFLLRVMPSKYDDQEKKIWETGNWYDHRGRIILVYNFDFDDFFFIRLWNCSEF